MRILTSRQVQYEFPHRCPGIDCRVCEWVRTKDERWVRPRDDERARPASR